jgi:type IV pilus assembly protein PilF
MQARGYLGRFMANTNASPDSLLLAVKIERKAGDYRAADDYAAQLRHDFPDSPQARQLAGGTLK